MKLEASQPATLGAVVEVVTRISTLGEAKILEMVSAGKIKDLFPFKPSAEAIPADTVDDHELVEASAAPLSAVRRAELIHASMPAAVARSPRHKKNLPER